MALSDDPTLHSASQSPKPTLLDLFESYPVFDRLCQHLPMREIINLTRTCRALSNLYQTLLRLKKWDVDRSLRRFVNDPRQLRAQLGKCEGLISGSFALQFFERVHWHDSDLDIFVEQGPRATELELYILSQEGYRLKAIRHNRDPGWRDTVEVHSSLLM